MGKVKRSGFLRRIFVSGLAGILPLLLSLAILAWFFGHIDGMVGKPISDMMLDARVAQHFAGQKAQLVAAGTTPDEIETRLAPLEKKYTEQLTRDYKLLFYLRPIGVLILCIVLIMILGFFLQTFQVGRGLFGLGERVLGQIPFVKTIYPYAKQISDFFFKEDARSDFSAVVVVEYPRKGVWSVGFITGHAMKTMQEKTGVRNMVNVFIPSSPTPVTGYVVVVSSNEVISIDIGVDDAFRFCVSGGVLMPDDQIVEPSAEMKHLQPVLQTRALQRSELLKRLEESGLLEDSWGRKAPISESVQEKESPGG